MNCPKFQQPEERVWKTQIHQSREWGQAVSTNKEGTCKNHLFAPTVMTFQTDAVEF